MMLSLTLNRSLSYSHQHKIVINCHQHYNPNLPLKVVNFQNFRVVDNTSRRDTAEAEVDTNCFLVIDYYKPNIRDIDQDFVQDYQKRLRNQNHVNVPTLS